MQTITFTKDDIEAPTGGTVKFGAQDIDTAALPVTSPPPEGHVDQFLAHVRSGLNPLNVASGMIQLGSKLFQPEEAGKMVLDSLAAPFKEAWEGQYGAAAGDMVAAALWGKAIKHGAEPLGRGMEAVGESQAARYGSAAGVGGMLMHGNVEGAALAATTPWALKLGGKGLQWFGRTINGNVQPIAEADALRAAVSDAVAKGKLRQVPGWTAESEPLSRPKLPKITDREKPPIPHPAAMGGPERPPIQVVPTPETQAVMQAPTSVPPAAPTPPAPSPPVGTEPPSPTPPATKIAPGVAFKQALDAFKAAGETAQKGEVANVQAFIQRGFTPADAVAKVIEKRPAPTLSPAEQLAQRLAGRGAVSDAEVVDLVAAKNARTTRAKGGTK